MSMELKSLNGLLAEKRAEVKRIGDSFTVDEKGRFSLETAQAADYKKAVSEAQELKSFIDAASTMDSIGSYLDAPAEAPESAQAAGVRAGGMEAKSLADVFIGSEQYGAARERGFDVGRISGSLEGKSLHSLSGGSVTHQTLGQIENLGLAERKLRKTRVRDLFPKSTTKSAVLYGVREVGWVNSAKQVKQRYAADGTSPATGADSDVYGWKPKSNIMLQPVTIPVATIAHTLDAHKNLLDDEPRLRTFLNTRMADGVKYAEDYDLLHSVGDAERITGLFNQPGIQNYTGLATDQFSVQVRRAITMAQLAEYDPSGLVISPEAWESLEVEEDNTGAFRVAVSVAVGAVKQVWHLDVVATTAMPEDKFLIGAFGMGAQIHDRESVNVTMSTENRDNYERNVVTFRAEERLALEVPRPESFVLGSWTTPTP